MHKLPTMASSPLHPIISQGRTIARQAHGGSRTQLFPFLVPFVAARHASGISIGNKAKAKQERLKKKKAKSKNYKRQPMSMAEQFSLCDAMRYRCSFPYASTLLTTVTRYLQAFEVGRSPKQVKYELSISMRTVINGPVVRSRLRLPHGVDSTTKIAVICPPDSPAAQEALQGGAILVGEDNIIKAVKEGNIDFNRLLLHPDSQPVLQAANLGRILGPKSLMPNTKTGTIVKDIAGAIRDMAGGSSYREKKGVVRLAIGQLGFTPEMLRSNISVFMDKLKQEVARLNEGLLKEIHEVVRFGRSPNRS